MVLAYPALVDSRSAQQRSARLIELGDAVFFYPYSKGNPMRVFRLIIEGRGQRTSWGTTGPKTIGPFEGAVFCAPDMACINYMGQWVAQTAWETDGGHGARGQLLEIEAIEFRSPLEGEKTSHDDNTDNGEVIVTKGEVKQIKEVWFDPWYF